MRRILTLIVGTLVTGTLIAGGLVTNTNQSASWVRLPSRNASIEADAVYYNPAGLMKMENGFHFAVSNQTIFQTREITSDYSYLHSGSYEGSVKAPLFPSVAAAYKLDKFAVSFGFNPVGGGGGATYETGLPSFEMGISDLVPLTFAKGFGTTDYSADIFFEGSSIYFGYQANVSYKINDMISVAVGMRLVTAKNTYNGYLRNIRINPIYTAFGTQYNGDMVLASDFFSSGETALKLLEAGATSYAANLQPLIDNHYGAVFLRNAVTAEVLDESQVIQIQNILHAAGQSDNEIYNATIISSQAILEEAVPGFNTNADALRENADDTRDIEVNAKETGMGYSPIISINISPADNINISLKYEFKTKLELETKLIDSKGGGIFIEGEKVIADMPAMLAAGVEFKPQKKLMVTGSMNYYFDKDVDYDSSEDLDVNMIDKNFMEIALGGEYGISDQFRVSAGWLGTFTGVNANYQNEQRFSLNTHSFGGGFGFKLIPMLDLNIGGQYTIYKEGTKSFDHILGTESVGVKENYNKNTWVVAVGLDLYFGI